MRYLLIITLFWGLTTSCSEDSEEQTTTTQTNQETNVENDQPVSTDLKFKVEVKKIGNEKYSLALDASKGEVQIFNEGRFVPLEMKEGNYIIEGKLPQLGSINLSPKEQILLVLEEGVVEGEKNNDSITIYKPGENYNLQIFSELYRRTMEKKKSLDNEYMAKGDLNLNQQLKQEYSLKLAEMDIVFEKELKAFIDTITPSFVGVLAVSRLFNEKNMVYLSPILDKYRGDKEKYHYAVEFLEEYDKRKQVTVGFKAPDFSLKTPGGKTFKLSSLKGKVVLIDFWASWCGPCRKENPNVLRMYNKYKNKGFDIIGVSLDREEAQWQMAIEKDGLSWNHVWDRNNEVATVYNVNAIPQTFLLDEKGVIIAKNLRGSSLEDKLAEIL